MFPTKPNHKKWIFNLISIFFQGDTSGERTPMPSSLAIVPGYLWTRCKISLHRRKKSVCSMSKYDNANVFFQVAPKSTLFCKFNWDPNTITLFPSNGSQFGTPSFSLCLRHGFCSDSEDLDGNWDKVSELLLKAKSDILVTSIDRSNIDYHHNYLDRDYNKVTFEEICH